MIKAINIACTYKRQMHGNQNGKYRKHVYYSRTTSLFDTYSQTCQQWPHVSDQRWSLVTGGSSIQVKSNAEGSNWSLQHYFWPVWCDHLSITTSSDNRHMVAICRFDCSLKQEFSNVWSLGFDWDVIKLTSRCLNNQTFNAVATSLHHSVSLCYTSFYKCKSLLLCGKQFTLLYLCYRRLAG